MHEHESREDYLERILMIQEKYHTKKVHAIDIAKDMNFSKASVSVALKKLKQQDLIIIDENGAIILTKQGEEIANKIYERHKTISKWLISIGVNKETALKDACLIEHDLSDETYQKIKDHVKNYQ